MDFWLERLGLAYEIAWAPFGQVFQSLLDPQGPLRSNKTGVNVVLLRRTDLGKDVAEQQRAAQDLRDALEGCITQSSAAHIVVVCPSAPEETSAADSALASVLGEVVGVDVVTPTQIAALYPTASVFDAYADHEGGVPFTDEYYAAVATMLARRIRLAKAPPKKLLVVDCDDTLWGGVVGEVGTSGVVIDEPRLALQRFLLEQRELGMLLAVVSKNNEADALAVFSERKEMLLRREHLTAWRINWQAKSANILDLARELEIGVDAMVFLDDDAFVTSEVREGAPGLVAVQLPEDPQRIPELLRGLWVLDRGRVTEEDRRRAETYKVKAERDRVRRTLSHADFIATLELAVTARALGDEHVPRVSQLTFRTNQFNASGKQRSEAEIRSLPGQGLECLVVDVRDRFGEYGLTGAVIFGAHEGRLVVDSFLLSCRVLGRGVEHRIIAELGRIAAARGLAEIVIPFSPTPKNAPYASFFEALPATRRDSSTDGRRSALVETATATSYRYVPSAVFEEAVFEGITAPKAGSSSSVVSSFDDRAVALSLSRVSDIQAALPRRSGGTGVAESVGNATTQAVSAIVGEVMLLDSVSVADDLFELGADSVAALRILAKIHSQLGVELPLYELFQLDPLNITKICQAVEARQGTGGAGEHVALPPISRTDVTTGTTTSFAQDVLLEWERHRAPTPTWTYAWRVRVRGALDVGLLRTATLRTLERQEALRQVFERTATGWVGRLGKPSDIPFEVVDMKAKTEDDVSAFCENLANSAVDIDDKPLIRFILIERGEADHVLLAVWHQLANDPAAGPLLTDEIATFYGALVGRHNPDLAEMPIRYVDHAATERAWWYGEGEPRVEAARKRLDDARPLELTDFERKGRVSEAKLETYFRLDAVATRNLQAISTAAGVSLFTLFAAIVGALLSEWSGRPDVIFVTPINARSGRSELEKVVGRFANWAPIRIDVSGDPTFAQLLERASQALREMHQHEAVPAPLVYGTNDIFEHPLNRVVLNSPGIGRTMYKRELPEARLTLEQEVVEAHSGNRNELAIALGTAEDFLFCLIRAEKSVFKPETIKLRSEQLRAALHRVRGTTRVSELFAASPDKRLGAESLAPEVRRRADELIHAWTRREGFIGAYLFGSLVRPYSDDDSDVDLRIVLEDDALAALRVDERRNLVRKDSKKEADVWLMSRSQLEAMSLEVDLHALSRCVVVHDNRRELEAIIERVSTMSEEIREERLRLHFFEMAFGIQKLTNALRRQKRASIRLLATGIVNAAAKLLFVSRYAWPATTSWMFEELALDGVDAETIDLMKSILENPELRDVRELRARVERQLGRLPFTTDPEGLLEWYMLTPEGFDARRRWASDLSRIGT